ncbi:MAG: adenylate/guanylate cyclase domain-containing protein [Candidatus Coatesbacteria bacterium]
MAEPTQTPASPPPAPPARGGFRVGLRLRFTVYLAGFLLLIMSIASYLVIKQQRSALDKEIRERGLALARALAANSVEPLSLGGEAPLQLMLLVKTVIQMSDENDAADMRGRLTESLGAMVWHELIGFGRGAGGARVRNEGVLFAKIVDPAGKKIAMADAQKPPEQWVAEMDQPYQPPAKTTLLSPGEDERVWESPDDGGIYVIAVPIHQRTGATGAEALEAPSPAPGAGGPASTGGSALPPVSAAPGGFMGSVYLGMSQSIVRRALAVAFAKLVYVAASVLVLAVILALFISGTLVGPIHQLRDGALAVGAGQLDTHVGIRRRDELGELAFAFNGMTKGLAERELIRGAFGAYVSSDVLTDILANPEAMKTIGGVKRTVTMVFTDVRGFTAMAGVLEAEQVVAVINDYLDLQAKQVRVHKGHVDKYIGDAVRAVFGIPSEAPDDVERAVRCAWGIKQDVAKLVADRKSRGEPHPLIGIGVDTGEVVAGNIGAANAKLEYTVIGDPVGMSEACMDAARDPDASGGQVVLTESTYGKVRDLVEVREMPPLKLQGRDTETKIYELVGLKTPASSGG